MPPNYPEGPNTLYSKNLVPNTIISAWLSGPETSIFRTGTLWANYLVPRRKTGDIRRRHSRDWSQRSAWRWTVSPLPQGSLDISGWNGRESITSPPNSPRLVLFTCARPLGPKVAVIDYVLGAVGYSFQEGAAMMVQYCRGRGLAVVAHGPLPRCRSRPGPAPYFVPPWEVPGVPLQMCPRAQHRCCVEGPVILASVLQIWEFPKTRRPNIE